MSTIVTTTEQIEAIVEATIERRERERVLARSTDSLSPTGHDLWNRFDHEAGGNSEFTTWQMVLLHSVMCRIADERAASCPDHRERTLWKAYQAAYCGDEGQVKALFKAAYSAPTDGE